MGFHPEALVWPRGARHRSARQPVLVALATVVLVLASGCGNPGSEPPSAGGSSGKPAAPATASRGTPSKTAAGKAATPAGTSSRVRLTYSGCVQFDPVWANIRVGQSLSWTSALPNPVTLRVSAGAFDKSEYVIRPGATVTTGPARAAGWYTVSSTPAACQGAPRGVRGSGPGVTVGNAVSR